MTAVVIDIATQKRVEGGGKSACHLEPGSVLCHVRRGKNECPGSDVSLCFSSRRTPTSLNPHIPEMLMGSVIYIPASL
jgi:hypothetical protein